MTKKLAVVFRRIVLGGIMVSLLSGCGAGNTGSEENTAGADGMEVAVTQAVPTMEIKTEDSSLKELFSKYDMKVGTCITGSMISNPKHQKLILEHFNSVTMENMMKPDYILNRQKSKEEGKLVVEFNAEMKKILDWAKLNGMAVRGHTLIWYSQTPEWIYHEDFDEKKELVSREVMLTRMENYIKDVFAALTDQGYIELFYAYDVVNEAWMEDGKMRDNNWVKTIGDDYIWHAFNFASKYAPDSIDLYYNDYNEQFKTGTLLKFVNTLVDVNGNYLIDGIGFQAHLYTEDNLTNYFKTVDTLAATGLKIQLTEIDVCLGNWQNVKEANAENFKIQGEFYYNLINGILTRAENGTLKTDAITFWGFMDGLSWRKQASPLLFNNAGEFKPAYYGVMQQKDKISVE